MPYPNMILLPMILISNPRPKTVFDKLLDLLAPRDCFQLSYSLLQQVKSGIDYQNIKKLTAFIPTDEAIKVEMQRCGYHRVEEFTIDQISELFCISFFEDLLPFEGFESNYYKSLPIQGEYFHAYIHHPLGKIDELYIMSMAQVNFPDEIVTEDICIHGISHVCRPPYIGDFVHNDTELKLAYGMMSDPRVHKYYLELLDKDKYISFFIGDNHAVKQLMKMNEIDGFKDFLPAFMEYVFKMHTMEKQIDSFESIEEQLAFKSLQGADVLVINKEGTYFLDYDTQMYGEFGRIDLKAINGFLQVISVFHEKK